jgi:hypothetical protein
VAKISTRQRELLKAFKELNKSKGKFLHIPVWGNKAQGLTKDTDQRSRSFLYTMLAASVAKMLGVNKIKFYENGMVSTNLPFSQQVVGGRATRSTHPKVLSGFSKLLAALVEGDFEVENPFLWKTKSDIVKIVKDAKMSSLIGLTNSCSWTRTTDRLNTHCGVCSQCIERRIATTHNDVKEDDPPERYKTDLFVGNLDRKEHRTMVESYIMSAEDLKDMSPEMFFGRFGEVSRILPYTGIPTSQAAEKLYELHKRQGEQVCSVIIEKIKQYAGLIEEGRVPRNSLLGFVLGRSVKRGIPDTPSCSFPTPEGAHWKDVNIEIISNESVRIRVMGVTKIYTAFDMGFRDRRRMDMMNRQWDLLVRFAEKNGVIQWEQRGGERSIYKIIQRLKETLKLFFRIDGSPIHNYQRSVGYRTKFIISYKAFGSRQF